MEASFSNALKSLLVIRVILFLALPVSSEGLIFSRNSNMLLPVVSYSWIVSRGWSSVAIISIICLNWEKFNPVWLYVPRRYGWWGQGECLSLQKRICVNLSGSDFLACSLILVEWKVICLSVLRCSGLIGRFNFFCVDFLALGVVALVQLYEVGWRGLRRLLLARPVVCELKIRWCCSKYVEFHLW